MSERNSYPLYTQNRELSWLRFNERVLLEALDEQVPLLERLKFVSIFTSNLDEFFMIRVGSLLDLSLVKGHAPDNKTGLSPKEQLEAIFAAVQPLIAEKDDICRQLQQLLGSYGICRLFPGDLDKADQKYLRQYFQNEVDPILSPQIIDGHHPFPHLANKVLHIGALLQNKGKVVFGVIPVPTSLPETLFLPGSEVRYVRTEDLILSHAERIFKPYAITEKVIFCITRNADIAPAEEGFEEDFRTQMKKLLRQRTKLAPVRLELSCPISNHFIQYFCEKLQLGKKQLYVTSSPMQMHDVFSLQDRLPPALRQELTYPPFQPQPPAGVLPKESMLRQDYVYTAQSRGNSRTAILMRHVLRNALIPAITFLAVSMAEILTGSIIIEQVFTIPGIGRLLLASISNRDFPVVQAVVVILAAWIVVVNFLADLLNQWTDPRVRLR